MAARVTLYTRKDCHLCEEAKAVLARVREQEPFDLDIVDVDSDPALSRRHGGEVPAVLIGGRKRFKYRVDSERLLRLLRSEKEEARDSMNEATPTPADKGAQAGTGGRPLAPYLQAAALFAVLLGVVLYAFPPETQKRQFVKNGSAAIPFELPFADGTGSLSWEKDLAGKVVLLNFWATWCGPCKNAVPEVMAFAEAKGLPVLAISDEDLQVVNGFLESWEKPFFPQIAVDGLRKSFIAYGVSGTPTILLVDGEGVIRHRQVGYDPEKGLTVEGWSRPSP